MSGTEYQASGKGDCANCHQTWWWCRCSIVYIPNPDYIGRR